MIQYSAAAATGKIVPHARWDYWITRAGDDS
jgi:hypothetical protein